MNFSFCYCHDITVLCKVFFLNSHWDRNCQLSLFMLSILANCPKCKPEMLVASSWVFIALQFLEIFVSNVSFNREGFKVYISFFISILKVDFDWWKWKSEDPNYWFWTKNHFLKRHCALFISISWVVEFRIWKTVNSWVVFLVFKEASPTEIELKKKPWNLKLQNPTDFNLSRLLLAMTSEVETLVASTSCSTNVWVKKTWTNRSSDTLLQLFQFFFVSDVIFSFFFPKDLLFL